MFEGHIFPCFYTDGTNESARTFILVDDKVLSVDNTGNFKSIHIFIYIFTHKSMVNLTSKEKVKYKNKGYCGTCRTDVLSTAVDNILNQNTMFGIRRLKLSGVDIYKPLANDYYGRTLIYSAQCENIGGDSCGN